MHTFILHVYWYHSESKSDTVHVDGENCQSRSIEIKGTDNNVNDCTCITELRVNSFATLLTSCFEILILVQIYLIHLQLNGDI